MAGSINTASLLVAMLLSTVMVCTALSDNPQIAVSELSEPDAADSQLGGVQDITATEDSSLETAALGRRAKKQHLQDRCVLMAAK
jgi:hypothetical protein